jgi:hypothetical protein
MDCRIIPSENSRFDIKLAVTASTPIDLIIKGFDPDHNNSIYFEREVLFFKGSREFDCPMPISPKTMKLCVFNKSNKHSSEVKINYIKVVGLPVKPLQFSSEADMEFYRFIEKFCKNFGNLRNGIHYSPSKRFEIKISDKLYNDEAQTSVSSTPARTFRPGGEIEVSRPKFEKMTVFMRMLILLHERFHIRANTHNESTADMYAVKTYTALGYPKTEALYSFIKVFKPVNAKHEAELIARTEKLNNFLQSSI